MTNGPVDSIAVERHGEVAIVEIVRPEVKNALDVRSSRALARAFRRIEVDDDIAVAVLGGRGGTFCAGADLGELASGEVYEPWATGPDGPTGAVLSKPVIAAVEGHACAGGLGLALWCDLRVASETAVFGVFSRRWGVPMSDGTTVRLPRVVGLGNALDMLLTGRPVAAREALSMGLANRVVPTDEALEAAVDLAEGLAGFPRDALLCDRRSACRQFDLPLAEALREETRGAVDVRDSGAVAGARRFVEGSGRHGDDA